MLAPCTVLQNRYEIVRLIAEGGMGAVYLARDRRLDSLVALKETHFTGQRMSKAFEREARLLARLRHPALPRVSDHFIEENGQFLIMEYIPGEDLAQMLKRRDAPLPSDDVIRWADQLLDALEYLHSQEPPIVHRDIKPQNLKLNERGQIILLDFGLAKNSPLQMTRVTSSGSIYGFTPNYAPMEQIQGVGTDPRSDLYSLGATLYHCATGATPQDALTRAAAVVDGQPDPLSIPSEMNGNVLPAVAAVLLKAMALSRNQRHPSAAEMRHAMTAACSQVDAANQDTNVIGAPRRPVTAPSQEQPPALVMPQPQSEETDAEATLLTEEPARQEDVHPLLSSGAAAFDAGEYAVAVEHWEAALKHSPDEPGVKQSIDSARRLIRKEEGRKARVERLVAEGTAAFDAKRYEAAIEKWSEALTLSPDEPGVEASVKAAREAAEKQGQREAKVKHLVLGGTEAFDVGDYEPAIQRWTEVLALSPDEPGIKKSIEAAAQKRHELQEAAKEKTRSYDDETAAKRASHFARWDVRQSPVRTHWPTYLLTASPRIPVIIGAGIVGLILLVVLVLFKQLNQVGSQSESRLTSVAQLPQPQGMLNDFAGKLSPGNKFHIETLLENFRDRTGIEVAVVTVSFDDLQGYPIDDYALQLGRKWGVGRDSEKRALVLIVAIKPPDIYGHYQVATRLEVSRHLEGDVPDILEGELIRKMGNDFTAGRFDQALTIGIQTILATLAQRLGISMDRIDTSQAVSSTPSSAIAPAQSGSDSSHSEKPLTSLASGQPLMVTVEAATGDSWFKYQVDDSKPITMILKQGQLQELPPAQTQVTLNYGNRSTLKFKINNRDANFPPNAPKFKSKVVISRDNLGTFFR